MLHIQIPGVQEPELANIISRKQSFPDVSSQVTWSTLRWAPDFMLRLLGRATPVTFPSALGGCPASPPRPDTPTAPTPAPRIQILLHGEEGSWNDFPTEAVTWSMSSCPAQGTKVHCWRPLLCCQSSFSQHQSTAAEKSLISADSRVTGQQFGGSPSSLCTSCLPLWPYCRPWISAAKWLPADGPANKD